MSNTSEQYIELHRLTTFEGLKVGDIVTRITITGFQTFEFMGYDPKLVNGKSHYNYAHFLDSFERTKTERWFIDDLKKNEIYIGYDTMFVKIVEHTLLQKRIANRRLDIPLHSHYYSDNPLKLTVDDIKEEYHKSDVCMGEFLASIPADGLNLEEAFKLYIKVMKWAEGDRFFRQIGDNENMEEL